MTNSLGSRIQIALIGSITAIAICAFVILFINQFNVLQNQKIIDTMTTEYSIISLSEELIQSYNSVVKNPGNPQFVTRYKSIHEQLRNVIATLKNQITSKESKLLLLGVENTVNQVLRECDLGLQEVQDNNFLNISSHFIQANTNNDFVRDNVRSLLEKELEYLSGTQKKSQQIYMIGITTSLSIFILIFFVMIFFARSFSRQLITPLTELSTFAKDIANGDLESRQRHTLKITKDEIGSLTESIYTMVDKLTAMLDKEQRTSEEMKKTSAIIANNNTELQRMNTLMVGRELKMSELKKQIEELKKKLNIPHEGNS